MKLVLRLVVAVLAMLMLGVTPALAYAGGDVAPPASGGDSGDGGSGPGSGSGSGSGDGGGGGSGSAGPGGVSIPRVMVEDFSTDPSTVRAGEEFELYYRLRNHSATTRVYNMKVTVESADAAFLPLSGTTSSFIPTIGAGNYASRTLPFRALPSLEAKPYMLTISLEYEDKDFNAYTSSETVAVQVTQEVRAAASAPQLVPDMLMVGQEASLTFSIQNQGRSKLFNAKAAIPDGQALTAPEVFVGTIEPGASGTVDMMVNVASEADKPVEIEISYEDDNGTPTTFTQEVQVMAMEMPMPEEEFPSEFEPEGGMGLPLVPILAAAGIGLLALAVIGLVIRRARRRKADQADADLLASLDDEPLIAED